MTLLPNCVTAEERQLVSATVIAISGRPDADQVDPATQSKVHTVSSFLVQAVLTAAVHVPRAMQASHTLDFLYTQLPTDELSPYVNVPQR